MLYNPCNISVLLKSVHMDKVIALFPRCLTLLFSCYCAVLSAKSVKHNKLSVPRFFPVLTGILTSI